MQLSCRQIRRNVATLIAIAVAAFLLFSAPSHAGLLAEVSKDHWSFQAVGRLAGAGLADPLPERDSALPVDRYELARRVATSGPSSRPFAAWILMNNPFPSIPCGASKPESLQPNSSWNECGILCAS